MQRRMNREMELRRSWQNGEKGEPSAFYLYKLFRMIRVSRTVTKHIVHFNLVPRALATRSDCSEVTAIKNSPARIDGDVREVHPDVIPKAR
jgi:hypothetical protein